MTGMTNENPLSLGDASRTEGGALMRAIWLEAQRRGDTPTAAAANMGMGYSYMLALSAGKRRTAGLSREHLKGVASYLSVPVIHVYMLAGVVSYEDFHYTADLKERALKVYHQMNLDPLWVGYVPLLSEWNLLSPKVLVLLCLLYERGARSELFSFDRSPTEVA